MAVEDQEYQLALVSFRVVGEILLKLMERGVLDKAATTEIFDNVQGELVSGSGGKNGAAIEMLGDLRSKVGI